MTELLVRNVFNLFLGLKCLEIICQIVTSDSTRGYFTLNAQKQASYSTEQTKRGPGDEEIKI